MAEASSFRDLDSAQKLTQYNIDTNKDEIRDWLADENREQRLDIRVDQTPFGPSGRSIKNEEIKHDPFPSDKAKDVYGVETRLIYNEDLDPPFIVLTSMPRDL
ncbi:hypothetical protein GCM10009601_16860 [Streptomyces thermospinosisporus]|uniref:Bacterial CdiA-CT RNAse A domain-containing protein n=1 Tax=Streptomyces thermospinosisporus TaxID=161482 RepID=A0ABP4JDW6_9ACTN